MYKILYCKGVQNLPDSPCEREEQNILKQCLLVLVKVLLMSMALQRKSYF